MPNLPLSSLAWPRPDCESSSSAFLSVWRDAMVRRRAPADFGYVTFNLDPIVWGRWWVIFIIFLAANRVDEWMVWRLDLKLHRPLFLSRHSLKRTRSHPRAHPPLSFSFSFFRILDRVNSSTNSRQRSLLTRVLIVDETTKVAVRTFAACWLWFSATFNLRGLLLTLGVGILLVIFVRWWKS